MQPSPYRPGELADSLPGRERLLLQADERLSRMCDLGRLVGRAQVFTAARGFGKTSLLRAIQRRAEARGAVTAWVTAGEEHGLVPALGDAVREATRDWREVGRLLPAIEQAKISFNLGVTSAEATLRRPDTAGQSGARALEALVREVVAAGKGDNRRAVVLFVDEIQAADHAGLRTLAYAWQHLQAEGLDVPAGIFAAGLPDSAQVIIEAVSSSERFAYLDLDPLTPTAVVQALTDTARPLGVSWEPGGLEAAVEAAVGYPFTVQLIGDHAWQLADYPDAGGTITEAHASQACELALEEMTQLVEGRYSKATPAEREFMMAMAQLGDGPVRRGDVVTALSVTSTQVSKQRDSLLKQGLIRATAYGSVEFTIPGMAAYLRRRSEAGPRPQRWGFTRPGPEELGRARRDSDASALGDRPSPGPGRGGGQDLGNER